MESDKKIKVGILKETKTPPDMRVPLSPHQCVEVMEQFANVDLVVQRSDIRKFQDQDYGRLGITLVDDVSDCDILMGVKEVKLEKLIPNKTYLFFSHTYKKQPYNAKLLKTILEKNIRLVDYEMIKNPKGKRLIGFGRYAGVVGTYNAIRTFGVKHQLFDLKSAHLCHDRLEMESEISKIVVPPHTKIVLTGWGRVGHGAREIMSLLPFKEVSPEEFLADEVFEEPVFTHLNTGDYNKRESDGQYDRNEFYIDPSGYVSVFPQYAAVADMYIACHFWKDGSPFIFTREDMKKKEWKVSVVGDISCDIDGPVASTIRPSVIEDPIYGYNPFTEKEDDFLKPEVIAVMAVDNLPCELPKDASEDFGNELIDKVFPHLFGDDDDLVILHASETDLNGKLTPKYSYLQDYVDGVIV